MNWDDLIDLAYRTEYKTDDKDLKADRQWLVDQTKQVLDLYFST